SHALAGSRRSGDTPDLRIGAVPQAAHARATHQVVPGIVYGDLYRGRPVIAVAGRDAIEIPHMQVRRVDGDGDRASIVARVDVGQLLRRYQDVPVGGGAGGVPIDGPRRARTCREPGERLRANGDAARCPAGQHHVDAGGHV